MNAEDYFPEGLSVIHPDDTHGDVRSASEDATKFPVAIHCHICYESINNEINNADYIKPCKCQLMFVHANCALRKKSKFNSAKCSSCGGDSTIPRLATSTQLRKVGSGSGCCSTSPGTCTNCNDSNYLEDGDVLGYKLKPCFCRKLFHFGCLRSLIEEQASCSECSVIFSAFKPANFTQFFKANWIFYFLYALFLGVCSTSFLFALSNSLIFTKGSGTDDDINKEIALSLLSVFFFVIIVSTMFCVIKYTISIAIPKFKITRGKVILKAFKNGAHPKTSKQELEPLQSSEFENIPLNDLRKSSAGDTVGLVEEARCEVDDITLGQHMFGVYATHHSSSTPIEKPPLGFVFN